MEQLQNIQTATLDLRRRSIADLIFSGSNLQIEKNKPSLAVGINYIAFSAAFAFMAGLTFMPVLYSIVMIVIGLAVVLRVPGRWLAVLAFALPCCALLFYYNMFPPLPKTDLFRWYPYSYWRNFVQISFFLTEWWGVGLLIISSLFAGYKMFRGTVRKTDSSQS